MQLYGSGLTMTLCAKLVSWQLHGNVKDVEVRKFLLMEILKKISRWCSEGTFLPNRSLELHTSAGALAN